MRLLILSFIILGLVTCKQVYTKTSSDKLDSDQKTNEDQSTMTADSIGTNIKNVTYSTEYLEKDGEDKAYMVRRTNRVHTTWGAMGQQSEFKIDIFDVKTRELIKSFSMSADVIAFSRDGYIQSTSYGCCGAENDYAFSKLWTEETFLQFNTKYYYIEIPNARISFYFGFLSARDEQTLQVGELYFVQKLPVFERGRISTYQFKNINKVIFRAKTKELFDTDLPHFCPDMTLVKNTEKDQLFENETRQELRLWSLNKNGFKSKGLRGLNFTGIKLIFGNRDQTLFEIPVENGYLFGDSVNYERTLYIGR